MTYSSSAAGAAPRILIVDDNRAIHADIGKVLAVSAGADVALAALEAVLFAPGGDGAEASGAAVATATEHMEYRLDSAFQGLDAVALARRAVADGDPYSLAFVDVRMPPGIDGIETTRRLWDVDPELEIVLCTAFSDYSWVDIHGQVGASDQFLILKKPFDHVEVRQLASALTTKRALRHRAALAHEQLEALVDARTRELREVSERLQREIAEREALEAERRQAHKLEAVGRLAAGVAHELNTPIQFVSDNLRFLGESLEALVRCRDATRELCVAAGPEAIARLEALERAEDVEFIVAEMPQAITHSLEGTIRVRDIVRALRDFARADTTEKELADINHALLSTLTVARKEYCDVAEVVTELAELPPVSCHVGRLNQVFLNLIVNAAHAIADGFEQGAPLGRITVRTRLDEDAVVIEIADTGCGIPPQVRERIFEPFYTTKAFGQGSGQGLAIARAVVVEKHGGTISVESTPGEGTTFSVRLPL